jgi:heme-degrading monooxygenase HmoA
MYSRVTLLEIDTLRVDIDDAAELFRADVAPRLAEQEGYEGAVALVTPYGKGMIITFWETEAGAQDPAGIASAELERNVTMFKSPPGREYYEVAFADMAGVAV